MIDGMILLFVLGVLIAIGCAWVVIRIKSPYVMLISTLGYLLYLVPYGFEVERHEKLFGFYNGELGKLLGIILAVISGGLISIALAEIRARHLLNCQKDAVVKDIETGSH